MRDNRKKDINVLVHETFKEEKRQSLSLDPCTILPKQCIGILKSCNDYQSISVPTHPTAKRDGFGKGMVNGCRPGAVIVGRKGLFVPTYRKEQEECIDTGGQSGNCLCLRCFRGLDQLSVVDISKAKPGLEPALVENEEVHCTRSHLAIHCYYCSCFHPSH